MAQSTWNFGNLPDRDPREEADPPRRPDPSPPPVGDMVGPVRTGRVQPLAPEESPDVAGQWNLDNLPDREEQRFTHTAQRAEDYMDVPKKWWEWGTDIALAGWKGVIGVGEGAVGLLDIPTLGHAGQFMEEQLGWKPEEAKEVLTSYQSIASQRAQTLVGQAEGVTDTLEAIIDNPSVVAEFFGESLPLMGAGGAVARGLRYGAPLVRGAIGEGVVGAGLQAESFRQESETGEITPLQAGLSVSTGMVTGAITRVSGRLAEKLGVADIETVLAGGSTPKAAAGLVKAFVAGMVTEGALEELPQSMQETIQANIGAGRPWHEGVSQSAVIGLVVGSAIGGPTGVVGSLRAPAPEPGPAPPPTEPAPVAPETPEGEIGAPEAAQAVSAEPAAAAEIRPASQDVSPAEDAGTLRVEAPGAVTEVEGLTPEEQERFVEDLAAIREKAESPRGEPGTVETAPEIGAQEDSFPPRGETSEATADKQAPASVTDDVREKPREFASTQVELSAGAAAVVQDVGRRVADADLAGDGRATEPHITVKFGIQRDEDLDRVRKVLADEPPIQATLGKTSVFPASESSPDADVLVADVESEDLRRINAKIAAAVPVTDTHPGYRPHVTLAYVKPGAGSKYAGQTSLAGRRLKFEQLVFSTKAGEHVAIPLTGKAAAPVRTKPAKKVRPDVRTVADKPAPSRKRARPPTVQQAQVTESERQQLRDLLERDEKPPVTYGQTRQQFRTAIEKFLAGGRPTLGSNAAVELVRGQAPGQVARDFAEDLAVERGEPLETPSPRQVLSDDPDLELREQVPLSIEEAELAVQLAWNRVKDEGIGAPSWRSWLEQTDAESIGMILDNDRDIYTRFLQGLPDELGGVDVVEALKQNRLPRRGVVGRQRTPSVELREIKFGRRGAIGEPVVTPAMSPVQLQTTWQVATQRATGQNADQVQAARFTLLTQAHIAPIERALGVSRSEVTKRFRAWSNYPGQSMELQRTLNRDKPLVSQWTGIQNVSWVAAAQVNPDHVDALVRRVDGTEDWYEPGDARAEQGANTLRQYLSRVLLGIDTRIDFSDLTLRVESVMKPRGTFSPKETEIAIRSGGRHTVAHEIGHYLDSKWAREAGAGRLDYATQRPLLGAQIEERTSPERAQWMEQFTEFLDDIQHRADASNTYRSARQEVFARFMDGFLGWTERKAGVPHVDLEHIYDDHFVEGDFLRFVDLLQQKAFVDAKDGNPRGVHSPKHLPSVWQETDPLVLNPAEWDQDALLVSTGVARGAGAEPAQGLRETNLAALNRPGARAKTKGQSFVDKVALHFYDGTLLTERDRTEVKDSDEVIRRAVDRMKDNLRFLWSSVTPANRDRARRWYDGAHRKAQALAAAHHYQPEQVAGVIAALSPQKDWFVNVAMAERTVAGARTHERQNTRMSPRLWAHFEKTFNESSQRVATKKKGAARDRFLADRAKSLEAFQVYRNLGWNSPKMTDVGRAMILRAADELDNSRNYHVYTPEGGKGDLARRKNGEPSVMAWTSYALMANGISMLRDGSVANISEQLGNEHKVRSFFNNISAPWDPRSVTIDTHAVAAAYMRPLAQKAPEVGASMGVPASLPSGLSGVNAVIGQAYFELARELRVLPRELQSVTWEQGRALFTPEQKRAHDRAGSALGDRTKALLEAYRSGKIGVREYHDGIQKAFDGFAEFAWATTPVQATDDQGGVDRPGGRTREPGSTALVRARGADPRGAPGADPAVRRGTVRASGDRAIASAAHEKAPAFYSKLRQVVEAKVPKRASAEQVLNIVSKGGVKKDELDWSELTDWLRAQEGPVTKAEVLEFLDVSAIEIEEVELGKPADPMGDLPADLAWGRFATAYSNARRDEPADVVQGDIEGIERAIAAGDAETIGEATDAMSDELQSELTHYLRERQVATQQGRPTRYPDWTLPGGSDYRELLLRLPAAEPEDVFESGHFKETNIVAHTRFKTRTDADGRRVLAIEEVQSDWHQEGRKFGYQAAGDPKRAAEIAAKEKRVQDLEARLASNESALREVGVARDRIRAEFYQAEGLRYVAGDLSLSIDQLDPRQITKLRSLIAPVLEAKEKAVTDQRNTNMQLSLARRELQGLRGGRGSQSVPDAPFKTSWPELAMKRMLRYAADEGFDAIAWTTGQQQADRYDLEGGEGMKAFYDTMLPSVMRKLGKKWGATPGLAPVSVAAGSALKVARYSDAWYPEGGGYYVADATTSEADAAVTGETFSTEAAAQERLRELSGGDVVMHVLPVTPEMRDAVLYTGQPLFARETVSLRDLRGIADRRGTSLETQVERARAAGYDVETPAQAPRPRQARGTPAPPPEQIPIDRVLEYPSLQKFDDPGVREFIAERMRQADGFQKQRRNVQTWERTEALARGMELPLEQLRPGTAGNAEELAAYANAIAWTIGERERLEAKGANMTQGELLQLSEFTDQAIMLVQAYRGLKAETGRAMNILRQKRALGQSAQARFIEQAIAVPGFKNDLTRIREALAKAKGDPAKMLDALQQHAATKFDYLQAYVYNNMLSGLKTHMRNAIGNTANLGASLIVPLGAAPIDVVRSRLQGREREVFAGESLESARAVVENLLLAWQGAAFAFTHGYREADVDAALEGNFDTRRVELKPDFELFGRQMGLTEQRVGIRVYDWLKIAMNWPSRGLVAGDVFYRTLAKAAELQANSYAQARREGLTAGADIAARQAEILAATGGADAAIRERIERQAEEFAARGVFQEKPGQIIQAVLKIKNHPSPGVRLAAMAIVPFVRTPGAIMKQGLEWSPVGALMSEVKKGTTEETRGDLRQGVQAQGRVLLGSLMSLPLIWWAYTGRLLGAPPEDRGERDEFYAQGKLSNSIRIGDYYVRYVLFQPFSVAAAAWANALNGIREKEAAGEVVDEGDVEAAFLSGIAGAGASLLDQSFLSGLDTWMTAVQDPQRSIRRVITSMFTPYVPWSGALRNLAGASDEFYRRPRSVKESVQALNPWMAQRLKPIVTRHGEPARLPSPGDGPLSTFWRAAAVPVISRAETDKVTTELARLGIRKTVHAGDFKEAGETFGETDDQRTLISMAVGFERKVLVEEVIHKAAYDRWNDERRTERIEDAYTDASRSVGRRVRDRDRLDKDWTLRNLMSRQSYRHIDDPTLGDDTWP